MLFNDRIRAVLPCSHLDNRVSWPQSSSQFFQITPLQIGLNGGLWQLSQLQSICCSWILLEAEFDALCPAWRHNTIYACSNKQVSWVLSKTAACMPTLGFSAVLTWARIRISSYSSCDFQCQDLSFCCPLLQKFPSTDTAIQLLKVVLLELLTSTNALCSRIGL